MPITTRANALLGRLTGRRLTRVGEPAPGPVAAIRSGSSKAAPKRAAARSLGSRAITAPLPEPTVPRGRAKASNFFDAYPLFFETSRTTPQPTRLNLRHEAIFGQNHDLFKGARVLDIASHDGRWSFAALQSGAESVIGIEAREDLVKNSYETFRAYDVEPARYEFIAGDVFQTLNERDIDVDVVLCLGFLYHTLRYNELMRHIADCAPAALIIDSRIVVSDDSLVFLRTEPVAKQRNAVADEYSHGTHVLSGRPSAKAIETLVAAYGFEVERYSDWSALLRDNPTDKSVEVYAKGQRVTLRCVNVAQSLPPP